MLTAIPQEIYAGGIEDLKPQQVTAVYNEDMGPDFVLRKMFLPKKILERDFQA
ncbi:MAG: hypothetical protein NUV41_16155 [Eubacteriales bacterium]|jgi:hypothetical protein|nr:hypothetical protein [Eubacteriales bacterium]